MISEAPQSVLFRRRFFCDSYNTLRYIQFVPCRILILVLSVFVEADDKLYSMWYLNSKLDVNVNRRRS